jgi:Fe-S oxidoreductase
MLRAKAVKYKKDGANFRDRVMTSTDMLGSVLARPVISTAANTANKVGMFRKVLDKAVGVHHAAWVPPFASKPLRKRHKDKVGATGTGVAAGVTKGKLAIFATCYGNFNEPIVGDDLIRVLEHNDIAVTFAQKEVCCGMPKLELGDLETVKKLKEVNIPQLAKLVDDGWDLTAPVPSCVLMFRQELPLMFPDDPDVMKVKAAFFDPFEYLMLRHKEGKLKTDFKSGLGVVSYQAACHQRVQNFGRKTMEVLSLIPDTEVKIIERCSGHDGTYALKSERRAAAEKIVRPVARRVEQDECNHYGSDCPMAGHHIENALGNKKPVTHPISLMRQAYGI